MDHVTARRAQLSGAWLRLKGVHQAIYIPNQMPDITEALSNGSLKVLLLLGTNMLSSCWTGRRWPRQAEMVVCVDLFMNETARRFADVVQPGTAWLEELGFNLANGDAIII